MKTIELDAKVNFYSIELTDVIAMTSTMDNLREAIKQNNKVVFRDSLPEEEQNKYKAEYTVSAYIYDCRQVYDILCKLGFVCSDGETIIKECTTNDLQLKDNK